MPSRDYYNTLGVKRNASEDQIRKAYRELARKLHPDVNKSNDAEERFKALNEAYQVLSDPEKRKRFDRFGSDWERYHQPPDSSPSDFGEWFGRTRGGGQTQFESRHAGGEGFSDIIDSIFGSGRGARPRRSRTRRRGDDHEYLMQVGLREAYAGTTRLFEAQAPATCDECGGPGIIDEELCHACGGTGTVYNRTKLEVTIPAGVRDGQRVRVAGKGSPGSGGGSPGDVFLKVQIRSDPQFTLEQSDLRTDVDVPLYTAILGGEVVVSTLSGNVALTIPPETQNGRVFRLRGKGWPMSANSSERGDLLVRVQVRIPTNLTDDERATFERLRAARTASGGRDVA